MTYLFSQKGETIAYGALGAPKVTDTWNWAGRGRKGRLLYKLSNVKKYLANFGW